MTWLFGVLAWARSTWLGQVLAGVAVAMGLLFAVHKRGEVKGKAEAIEELTDADKRNAEKLRRRVDAARRTGGLHDDDLRYRD
jgi:DNA-binding IclR family transcriptional regulator